MATPKGRLCVWQNEASKRWATVLYSAHHLRFVFFPAFSKTKSQVTNGLSQGLHRHIFIVCEFVVLSLYASMLHQSTGIGNEAAHSNANMTVNFKNLLDTVATQAYDDSEDRNTAGVST